jgi:hypothetical protein
MHPSAGRFIAGCLRQPDPLGDFMLRRIAVAVAVMGLPVIASAQFISGVKIEPAEVKVGEPVKITVNFDDTGTPNCGMRINWGDGTSTQDVKINQKKDIPYVTTRNYGKAGTFTVTAEPKTQGIMSGCGRTNHTATVKVNEVVAQAAAVPAKAAAPAAKAEPAKAAGPSCPTDWALDAKSVNKRTGAYTCTAKAGTKLPETRLSCPGDLSYYENSKTGRLGCRP